MEAPRRIRTYLADDHPPFLDGLVRAVRGHATLELAGTAANGLQALDGGELHLSAATVKTYLQKVYEKLGVTDRTSAVVVALWRGLLE